MKRIKELFDSDIPYEIIYKTDYGMTVEFSVGSYVYEFEATKVHIGGETQYNIVFHQEGDFNITGTGDQFLIFGTIANIFKEFIRIYRPDMFRFAAKEKSRIRLYHTFANKIAKELGFFYETEMGVDGQHVVFVFRRTG
jgi:hypothetical protein